MLTHVVFFWAKADLTAAERADIAGGHRTQLSIPKVSAGWVGTPTATDRTVVDRSYTFGLTVRFEGLAEHDAYQIDPIHDAFHARCAKYWTKVAVYDVDDLPEDASASTW